jgi:hypothetical protein
MIATLTTVIATTGPLLMLTIGILIAQDGETAKTREAADWARIKGMFAEEREDLAEPVPVPAAATYLDEPPPYPWTLLPLEPGLLDRLHTYAERGVYPRAEPLTIGERARLRCGPITQEFARIVGVELTQLGTGSHRERRAAA